MSAVFVAALHQSQQLLPSGDLERASVLAVLVSADGRTLIGRNEYEGRAWVEGQGQGAGSIVFSSLLHSSVDRRLCGARGASSLSLSPDGQWLATGADGAKVFATMRNLPRHDAEDLSDAEKAAIEAVAAERARVDQSRTDVCGRLSVGKGFL